MAKIIEEVEIFSGSRTALNKTKAMRLFLQGDDDAFEAWIDTLTAEEQGAIADLIREIRKVQ